MKITRTTILIWFEGEIYKSITFKLSMASAVDSTFPLCSFLKFNYIHVFINYVLINKTYLTKYIKRIK